MRVLLVSTYELGQQPVSLGTAAAALLGVGHDVRCVDVAVDELEPDDVDWAERVALSVPMHTAMRLALRVADSVRARCPEMPLCFFGLYAAVTEDRCLRQPGDAAISGEFESGLLAWAAGRDPGPSVQLGRAPSVLPARQLLAPLERYTRLLVGDEERLVGSVSASRGCSHRCRHCPVPVIYDGRVRAAHEETVGADIDQLVRAGMRHVSFSDPDFLNAPHHSRRVIAALHRDHPQVTFDCTTKVEHILRYQDLWEEWAGAGCAFVVSAFESTNDRTLEMLDKGHTATEASLAVAVLRSCGVEVRPSWLPFTPWTTVADLVDLCDFVIAHDLVANVDPVQFSIRLLVPNGSLLLDRPEMRPHLDAYDAERLGWTWVHADPAVDQLHGDLATLVEARMTEPPEQTFLEIDALIRSRADAPGPPPARGSVSIGPTGARARLSEPWFCCSEPTAAQLAPLDLPVESAAVALRRRGGLTGDRASPRTSWLPPADCPPVRRPGPGSTAWTGAG